MKRKQTILQALVLGGLATMTVPGLSGVAFADGIGTVNVDGVAQTVSTEGDITAGADGSTVSIGKISGDSRSISFAQEKTIDVAGKMIDTAGINVRKGASISMGGASTDSITIAGTGTGTNATGLMGIASAQATIEAKTINISTDSKDAAAIWLQNNTQETNAPANATSVTLKGDTINITSPDTGIINYSNGQINIIGDTTINAPLALSVRGNSTTNINTDGAHTTVINGNVEFETGWTKKDGDNSGNIIDANVNMNLTGAGSSWTGRAYAKYTDEENGDTSEKEHVTLKGDNEHGGVSGLSLTMADGATWNVTGDTIMNTLTANDSTVNFQEAVTKAVMGTNTLTNTTVNVAGSADISSESLTSTDSTLNLEGANAKLQADKAELTGGTINLDGEGSRLGSDALNALGTTINMNGENTALTGNATVTDGTINVNSSAASTGDLTLNNTAVNLNGENTVLSVNSLAGSDATINTNSLDNQVQVGSSTAANLTVHGTGAIADAIAKDSSNAQKLANVAVLANATDKSIASQITTDEGVVAGTYNLKVENGTVNMAKSTYTPNVSNVGIASMAAMNLMTWRQENNDLNKRLGELRDSNGENGIWARMSRGEAKYGSRNMKNQYNYYQLGYDRKVGDNWTVGAAYSKTDGSTTFSRGRSDNDHNGFAIYGSYLANDGSFIDLIGKYARIDTDYNVSGGVGNGDYDADAYSLSAEYGKRFHNHQGFWIEPQAELTYGRVSSADYTSSRGAQVHHDSMDSTVARLGFAAGKDIQKGHVYVRASYLYDFGGDTNVTMRYNGTSESYKDNIGGSWWEVGLGTNLNLSDVTHFYMDLEKTYGGDITTPWQWNAGFRYSF